MDVRNHTGSWVLGQALNHLYKHHYSLILSDKVDIVQGRSSDLRNMIWRISDAKTIGA